MSDSYLLHGSDLNIFQTTHSVPPLKEEHAGSRIISFENVQQKLSNRRKPTFHDIQTQNSPSSFSYLRLVVFCLGYAPYRKTSILGRCYQFFVFCYSLMNLLLAFVDYTDQSACIIVPNIIPLTCFVCGFFTMTPSFFDDLECELDLLARTDFLGKRINRMVIGNLLYTFFWAALAYFTRLPKALRTLEEPNTARHIFDWVNDISAFTDIWKWGVAFIHLAVLRIYTLAMTLKIEYIFNQVFDHPISPKSHSGSRDLISVEANDFIAIFNVYIDDILKYRSVFMLFTIAATFLNTGMVIVIVLETLVHGTWACGIDDEYNGWHYLLELIVFFVAWILLVIPFADFNSKIDSMIDMINSFTFEKLETRATILSYLTHLRNPFNYVPGVDLNYGFLWRLAYAGATLATFTWMHHGNHD